MMTYSVGHYIIAGPVDEDTSKRKSCVLICHCRPPGFIRGTEDDSFQLESLGIYM